MKTLIIYGTKHGSAGKCAELLSQKLLGEVEVCDLKDRKVPEFSQYDKIIIGGPIYAGTLLKEVSEFCTKNLGVLKNKKIGLYICCMNDKAAEMQLNNAFPQGLLSICTVRDSFGGQFNFSKMNFFEKAITKMVTKALAKTDPNLTAPDMKKDISMIMEERINKFAQSMNAV